MNKLKLKRFTKRVKRVRNKIGSDSVRLCVFKSNRYFSAQIIDGSKMKTLVSVQEKELPKDMQKVGVTKTQKSYELGKLIATKAKKSKVSKVVFDRGGYKYHGRIKSFAEGAREGGLVF